MAMEILLSLAFGLWICLTAFAYRGFTSDRRGDDERR